MPQTAAGDPATRALRLISITTWVPSLALSIAHGVLSRSPYPSSGIIPHTVSAILAICVLRIPPDSDSDSDTESAADETHKPSLLARILHPFLVFLLDIAIAAGCVWVLVKTWLQDGQSNQLSMLAAYSTVPLMANFTANAGSGIHSLYNGLAISGIVQWIAWRAVPAECPNCHHHLRPSSLPEVPWLKRSKRRESYAPVLVQDDQERYHDESDNEESSADSPRQSGSEGVRNKRKNSKGKSTPFPPNPDLPWGASARVY
ncbi:hypothetical protein PT974_06271 [Cladobotryum mycophilum]|uniref:Uncharacterized protein n=1 Tax=Cladobotryum mycophilum TaxID=491253 RepID=A0ABR0SL46_9HYPO